MSECWPWPDLKGMHEDYVWVEGEGGCVLGGWLRRVQGLRGRFTHSLQGADSEVCVHGWIDGFWGSNLSWPWPRALVQIRRGPQEPEKARPLARIRQIQTGVFFCGAEGGSVDH